MPADARVSLRRDRSRDASTRRRRCARGPPSTADGRAAFAPADARWDDADSDGIPDREELHTFGDRENFRKWFTTVAEQQFYEPSREWDEDQRASAGANATRASAVE